MDIFANLVTGTLQSFHGYTLIYCLLGALLGVFVGVLPGIGTATALSLLLPMTFKLELIDSLVLLCGVYYGVQYGGAVPSICINIPGSPTAAITCIEGYEMAKKGRAGVALVSSAVSSFLGGIFGVLLMCIFAPSIAGLAIKFGPSEYFSIMLFTLIITASIQETNLLKNFIMIAFGILLGMVGIDVNTGVNRFTFGFLNLSDGINIIILISGLFGIGEILYSVKQKRDGYLLKINKLIPSLEDIKKSIMPCLRGSSIGAFFGALPGTGPTISSFVSYITEKKISKNPEQFGKGKIEGVVSPEAANNSAVQTALIPTLSMGVPGDPIMVIILSVFMMKGIVPGPSFIHDNNQLFWILSSSFVIGNFICLVLNISLIKVWVKITSIPYDFIFGSVIILSILGAYTLNNNVFDVIMIGVFGILGYLLKFYKFDLVCLILGFCLGPSIEIFLRRGSVMYNENYYNFLTSSNISLCFLLLSFLTLLFSIYKRYSKNI